MWHKENPPYVLYGAIGALLAVMVLTPIGLGLRAAVAKPRPESISASSVSRDGA